MIAMGEMKEFSWKAPAAYIYIYIGVAVFLGYHIMCVYMCREMTLNIMENLKWTLNNLRRKPLMVSTKLKVQ